MDKRAILAEITSHIRGARVAAEDLQEHLRQATDLAAANNIDIVLKAPIVGFTDSDGDHHIGYQCGGSAHQGEAAWVASEGGCRVDMFGDDVVYA